MQGAGSKLEITHSQLLGERQENAAVEFLRSAAYSGMQRPLTALVQPVDQAFDTQLEKSIQLIDAPAEAKFNTTRYWLQQTGSALGMVGSFALVGKGVAKLTRHGLSEVALNEHMSSRGALGLTLKESFLTGAMHDTFLRPTDADDTRGFVESRLGNGLAGGLTFTTMTAASLGLRAVGKNAGLEQAVLKAEGPTLAALPEVLRLKALAPVLSNESAIGVTAGLITGPLVPHTEMLLRHGRFATGEEMAQSTHQMAMIGGVFGLRHQLRGRQETGRTELDWQNPTQGSRQFRVESGAESLTPALSRIRAGEPVLLPVREQLGLQSGWRGWLGLRSYGPEQQMLIQHRGQNINPALAADANLIAACDLPLPLQSKSVVPAQIVHLEPGSRRIGFSADAKSNSIVLGDRANVPADATRITTPSGWYDKLDSAIRKAPKDHTIVLSNPAWMSEAQKLMRTAKRQDIHMVVDGQSAANEPGFKIAPALLPKLERVPQRVVVETRELAREVQKVGVEPEKAILDAVTKNQVVAIGEYHVVDSAHREFGASMMAKLKEAGVTHLAIESTVDNKGRLIVEGKANSSVLEPLLNHYEFRMLMEQAHKAGITVVPVDVPLSAQRSMDGRNVYMADSISKILDGKGNPKVVFWVGNAHLTTITAPGEGPSAVSILRSRGRSVSTFYGQHDNFFREEPVRQSFTPDRITAMPIERAPVLREHTWLFNDSPNANLHNFGEFNWVLMYPKQRNLDWD